MIETSKPKEKNVLVNVTIDTSVLAIPAVPTKSSIERYVERLLDWKELQRDSWVDINTSKFADIKLYEDNLYPDYETMKFIFSKNGVEKYNWQDVALLVHNLMYQTSCIEDSLEQKGIEEEKISAEQIATEPDIFKNCPGVQIHNDLKRCVVLLAVSQSLSKTKIPYHVLALHATQAKSIKVSALVSGIASYDDKGAIQSKSAQHLVENILVAEDSRGIIEYVDEAEILLKATSDSELHEAVKIASCKNNSANCLLPEYIIGTEFLSSIMERLTFKPELAKSLLRAIVETLAGSNMNDTHKLRTGKSGGSPNRKRGGDNAEAWRRDIDRDHHLHYWKSNNCLEFACVSYPHDNFDIPEN
jgi:hypothetical protein